MADPPKTPLLGTVLVTGGCGFLGSHIVEMFIKEVECANVAVVSRSPTRFRFPGASYHAGTITDRSTIRALLDEVKPKVIIHTVSPGSYAKANVQQEINLEATKLLLECATEHSAVEAFVYTSTDQAVVSTGKIETEETAQVNSLTSGPNTYARTKGATDTYVRAANSSSLKTAVIRVPGLYGPATKLLSSVC